MRMQSSESGASLLIELQSHGRKSEAEAIQWVESRTGYRFDPRAFYRLRFDDADGKRIIDSPSLVIHAMSEFEIRDEMNKAEKASGRPPRRAWEPTPPLMFKPSEELERLR